MEDAGTPTSLTGRLLGSRYHLLQLIKAGGMGAVYEARDVKLELSVAVKVLSADLTSQPDMVRRLFREARAASQIRHPNIVKYLDYDHIADGPAYLVMELLAGHDLERVLKLRGPLPWETLVPWLRQACRALSAAHAVGIIHRDIKPSNFVLVEEPGVSEPVVKLIDFGIVKLTPLSELRGDTEMTQYLLGTKIFMAPELFTGVTPNARSEVYALGVSIYRLLTGTYPSSEDYVPTPPSAHRPGIAPKVDALVCKCLELSPLARFPSMEAVEHAIAETLDDAASVPTVEPLEDAATTPRVPLAPAAARSVPSPPAARPWLVTTLAAGLSLALVLFLAPDCVNPGVRDPASPVSLPTPQPKPPPTAPEIVKTPPPDPTPVAQPDPTPDAQPVAQPDPKPDPQPVAQPNPKPDPQTTPVSTQLPEFSPDTARKILREHASRAKACGAGDELLPGTSVELHLTIAADGSASASPSKLGTLDFVKCVVKLANSLPFPPSANGGKLRHTFKM